MSGCTGKNGWLAAPVLCWRCLCSCGHVHRQHLGLNVAASFLDLYYVCRGFGRYLVRLPPDAAVVSGVSYAHQMSSIVVHCFHVLSRGILHQWPAGAPWGKHTGMSDRQARTVLFRRVATLLLPPVPQGAAKVASPIAIRYWYARLGWFGDEAVFVGHQVGHTWWVVWHTAADVRVS